MSESHQVPAEKKVLGAIRANLASLSPGERKIAQVILESPAEVIHMTVGELALRAKTAESTAVRCCHKLGYRGYQDLKIHLARELASDEPAVQSKIDPAAEPHEILRTVLAFNSAAFADITSSISPDQFDAAANAIADAEKVLLLGFGSSYFVSREAHERLASVGIDATAPESPNMKLLLCSRTTPKDVVVCISHTGATTEVIRYAEIARQNGATVVALTSFARSRLGQTADIELIAGGHDLDYRFDAMSGRLAHLAVLDAIYISLPLKLGDRATTSLATFHDEEAAWRL